MNYGKVTLEQVSKLVEQNLARAKQLGLTVSWGYSRRRENYYCRIHDGEKLCHEELYSGRHTHLIIAQLHDDLAKNLMNVAQAKQRAFFLKDREREMAKSEMEMKIWRGRMLP